MNNSDHTMPALSETVLNYIHQANENYAELRRRVMARAAVANQDCEPTVDKFGRLHAPFDGYIWLDCEYSGGSYLPFPPEFWEALELECGAISHGDYSEAGVTKGRVKLPVSDAEELCTIQSKYVNFSKGKSWSTSDGEMCYAYFETKRKGVVNLIEQFKADQAEEIRLKLQSERAAKRAFKGVAPSGRVAVVGKVIKTIVKHRPQFSYYDTGEDLKMMVELDNKATVWGNVPSAIADNDLEGVTLEFTATFSHAKDDATHAFFKRPSKVKLLK